MEDYSQQLMEDYSGQSHIQSMEDYSELSQLFFRDYSVEDYIGVPSILPPSSMYPQSRMMPDSHYVAPPPLSAMSIPSPLQTSQQPPCKPYSTSVPSPTLPIVSSQPSQHQPSSETWSQQDDQQLLQARTQGLNWSQIKEQYFPFKTPNTCRKRHERLIERRGPNDRDARKMQIRAKKEAYISLLADDLLTKALIEKLDEESLDRICRALPRHLKTFAMKIGSSDPAPICREVMVFVRKYRKLVGKIVQ
jgi:hypothetical protein